MMNDLIDLFLAAVLPAIIAAQPPEPPIILYGAPYINWTDPGAPAYRVWSEDVFGNEDWQVDGTRADFNCDSHHCYFGSHALPNDGYRRIWVFSLSADGALLASSEPWLP